MAQIFFNSSGNTIIGSIIPEHQSNISSQVQVVEDLDVEKAISIGEDFAENQKRQLSSRSSSTGFSSDKSSQNRILNPKILGEKEAKVIQEEKGERKDTFVYSGIVSVKEENKKVDASNISDENIFEITSVEQQEKSRDISETDRALKRISETGDPTAAEQRIKRVVATNRKGINDLRTIRDNNLPGSKRLNFKNNQGEKRFDFISEVGGVALMSLVPQGGNGVADPQRVNGLFLLQDFNERESARYDFVKTHGVDIINFFGKEINIWSYSGTTINGAVGSNFSKQDVASRNWYRRFSDFMSSSIGFPKIGINGSQIRHFLRLEYQNFVREGFLLDITYNGNSQNDKLIRFSFTVAISDFYNVPEKGGVRDSTNNVVSRGSYSNAGAGVFLGNARS